MGKRKPLGDRINTVEFMAGVRAGHSLIVFTLKRWAESMDTDKKKAALTQNFIEVAHATTYNWAKNLSGLTDEEFIKLIEKTDPFLKEVNERSDEITELMNERKEATLQ